ncbi:MAG: heme lyase CcmF/NrfE family subunit [Gammaproteobacteria bacterium]|nr:heme lyase CcmF/NrfE family subunit [Gammaproteobacteria bacterium]
MIPELGNFALIIALCFSLVQFAAPLRGICKKTISPLSADISAMAAIGQFIFLSIAFFCLILSFINNDLTVIFVREHSHSLLPIIYRIGAAWGGHEGSLLLWCLILSSWTIAFLLVTSCFLNTSDKTLLPKILTTLGLLSAGFIVFLFFTSNPFARNFPTGLIVGDDLTPLLQDPGLIFHPPMLYFGYVGFAIAFAFAISALIDGKLDRTWVQACRPWVIMPWSFLSCGIVLGSWWAYRELGWGGWWFWDPVENASLLPWLSATALIHALAVCEKRNVFKGWVILLAILTFSLSLLGTFLVRSGVLVSVHAFASDPTRGLFLLAYLTLIIGGSLFLYSLRIKYFFQAPTFKIISRETTLLINTVILVTAVATISIGTLYPIILDTLNLEKISVGEPYFTTIFLPIMLPLLLLMGVAPHVSWGEQSFKSLWKKLHLTFVSSFLLGFIAPALLGFPFHILAALGISLSAWIILGTAQYAFQLRGKISLRHWSMIIAHIGIAIFALGVSINKSYSEERQVKMKIGETVSLAGYEFTFKNLEELKVSNYQAIKATFSIQKNHSTPELLFAEQRVYTSHEQSLSRPGIVANVWRDLYLALGSTLADNSWSVRIYYKPCVRWIWFGGFMLLIGGLLSLLDYWNKRNPA